MKYTKRVAEKTFRRLLKAFPIVGITGPRQSVKSTLLKHLLKDYTYVTFDDIRKVQLFEEDPIGFIERYKHKVIFDEVQLVPAIFATIKMVVDQDRHNYGNFVLTGSS
ncbi:MAG: AAA family ATPase [Simkaniaceae bacterium]|nr:MAG: AAA family ATPase [Simkaniaceae bacterium]